MDKLAVFHASPSINDRSILSSGLNVSFAKTARKCLWFVQEDKLAWALAHVSLRHKTPVNNLTVWTALVPVPALIRTRWTGVYQYASTIPADCIGAWDLSELDYYLSECVL